MTTLLAGGLLAVVTFCVVDGVLFRELSYTDSNRLFVLGDHTRRLTALASGLVSQHELEAWHQMVPGTHVTGVVVGETPYFVRPLRRQFRAAGIDQSFFDVIGTSPLYGGFSSAEFTWRPQPETGSVFQPVLISHRLWLLWLAGDPDVVGRPIDFADREGLRTGVRIMGILRPDFVFPVDRITPDFLIPIRVLAGSAERRRPRYVGILRLPAEVDAESASRRFKSAAEGLRAAGPMEGQSVLFDTSELVPITSHLGTGERHIFVTALGCAALLMLLTSVNAAALTVVRLGRRIHDLAIRAMLGAGTIRLLCEQVLEVAVICSSAMLLVVLIVPTILNILTTTLPESVSTLKEPALDGRALAVTMFLTLTAVLIIGVVPTVTAITRLRPPNASWVPRNSALLSPRMARWLIAAEIAISVILLMAATVTLVTVVRVWHGDSGYRREGMVVLELHADRYATPFEASERLQGLTKRFELVEGVTDIALSSIQPMFARQSEAYSVVKASGRQSPPTNVASRRVTENFFRVMEIKLRAGRWPTPEEWRVEHPVGLLSATAAKQLWPNEEPLGRVLAAIDDGPPAVVIGVVDDTRYVGLDAEPIGDVYLPGVLGPSTTGVYAIIRTVDPMRVLPVLTDLATRANVVAFQASSFADALLWLMRGRLLAAALFGAFGLAAWSVAFTGTFSLVAVLVAEQRRQIAIRSALGASRIRLLVTVTSAPLQGLVIGLGVGAAAVVVFGGSLQALLYGVHVFEPTLWLMVTVGLATSVILGALAACAAWRPLELAKLLNVN